MSEPERRAGLPDPSSVVAETVLASPAAAAPGAAPAPRYRILRTVEVDAYDTPPAPAAVAPFGAPAGPPGDEFQGTSRKASKLSLATAAEETFQDVRDLIATLPAHAAMVNHVPAISKAATSRRVKAEKRNVRVTAFLYAASVEDDRDYHLIVGRAPGAAPPVYMTMELSGLPLPGAPHRARLEAARKSYKDFFGANLPGTSYDFYDPPIPIEIAGSLFFDMSHATGSRPGPQSLRPHMPVVWEIHPVSDIRFEP